ncbi:MAG: CDP-alcohol phosphatidyltransferase family protein [Candidatus Hermodarchaeia archaeon]
MPSRFRLRRVFKPLVRGLARGFIRLRFSPNMVSALAFFVACLAALFITLYWWILIYGILVFIAGLLDGVDGEVARQTNQASLSGGFLDSLLDRVADVVVLLPFLWLPNPFPQWGPSWWWVTAAVIGVILVSYARSRAQAAGVTDTDVGLAARSERLFILVVASCLAVLYPPGLYLGLLVVAILSHLTVAYRVLYYRRQLQGMVFPKP